MASLFIVVIDAVDIVGLRLLVVVPSIDVSKVELIIFSYVVEIELDRDSMELETVSDAID